MTLRRGFHIEPGQKVLVVEDVVTTGGSVQEVLELVHKAGGDVVGVCVVVDRTNGQIDVYKRQGRKRRGGRPRCRRRHGTAHSAGASARRIISLGAGV